MHLMGTIHDSLKHLRRCIFGLFHSVEESCVVSDDILPVLIGSDSPVLNNHIQI